jgi:RNA polymerase sigma-70 factor (ECF subfamily)
MAWLKQMLLNNLADTVRGLTRAKRDPFRERSLNAHISESFIRVEEWLAAVQSSHSHHLARAEDLLRLADSLNSLPQLQREAIVLHYLQGLSVAEVGQQLDKTPSAVAGLLRRGLVRLRELLASSDSSGPSCERRNP